MDLKQYQYQNQGSSIMIYVGIDVAKDKHDCFITNSDGEVLFDAFTIINNLDGFTDLFNKIHSTSKDLSKIFSSAHQLHTNQRHLLQLPNPIDSACSTVSFVALFGFILPQSGTL